MATRAEAAEPVIKKIHKRGVKPNPLIGLVEVTISGKRCVVRADILVLERETEGLLDEIIGGSAS